MSEQIKQMVNKFLCWKLPDDFYPDNGISFNPLCNSGTPHWPVGTNLLTADQAKEMFEACVGEQLQELGKQRDELLAALISAVDTIEWMDGCTAPAFDEVEKAIRVARAVIGKARGEV